MEDIIGSLSTFGFGAIMAVLIFIAYERLVREVVAVVRANTKAMEELAVIIDGLRDKVGELSRRISVLERRDHADGG